MKKLNLKSTTCAICGSKKDYTILYKANFQDSDLNKLTYSARRLPDGIHYRMVRCKRDGLVRSDPIADQNVILKVYKDSLFSYQSEVANLEKTYLKSFSEVIRKLPQKAKILEIGCGNGFLLKRLRELGFINVYGVEPSQEAIKSADLSIRRRIKQGFFKKGLYPKNSFDLILMFQTLDHIAKPNDLLRESFNVLKRGGHIVIFNHNVESLSASILGESSPIIDIEHTYLYSSKTLKLIVEKNGFIPEKVFFPANTLSINHLIWLAPLPKLLKQLISRLDIQRSINLRLGNLCLIASKP